MIYNHFSQFGDIVDLKYINEGVKSYYLVIFTTSSTIANNFPSEKMTHEIILTELNNLKA